MASYSPSLFSFFFFYRLLPISKVVSSPRLPVCNSHQFFFFFPSIYACNNTSRVKAGETIVSFFKLFLSFSLSVLSPVPTEIYISAKIDWNDPKLSGIGLKVEQVELPFQIASCTRYSSCSSQNAMDLIL